MSGPGDKAGAGLRAWVLLRLPVPALAVALFPNFSGEVVGERLTRLDYAHGFVKGLLIGWHSMLVREARLVALFALVAVAGLVLAGLRGRAWAVAMAGVAVAAALILRPLTWWTIPLAVGALALNFAPYETLARLVGRLRALAWVPGTELVATGPVAAALGVGPRGARVAAMLGGLAVAGGWVLADTFGSFWEYERIVFAPWSDDRVDPRVTTVARAAEGVKCDFHDIDVVGDRAVVLAETQLNLVNVPRDGGPLATWPITPWWGPMEGLALDSETDPTTGHTWYLSGPDTITAVAWDGAAWKEVARTPKIPAYLHHTYSHWLPGRDTLYVFTIGTHNTREDSLVVEVDTPGLTRPRVRRLRLPDGSRPPTIRDLAWVPTLDRFVLAPDFGDRLYLYEPGTSTVEPWIEMPTLNGRLTWVGGLDRLFVPLPNKPELWIVDPVKGVVERRFRTQPGVRTLAVDVARELVLTASVLTGRVLVQRLDDASVVDSFGTIMPMVRNLAIFPERGEALLSTWTALYRVPYAPSATAASHPN